MSACESRGCSNENRSRRSYRFSTFRSLPLVEVAANNNFFFFFSPAAAANVSTRIAVEGERESSRQNAISISARRRRQLTAPPSYLPKTSSSVTPVLLPPPICCIYLERRGGCFVSPVATDTCRGGGAASEAPFLCPGASERACVWHSMLLCKQ